MGRLVMPRSKVAAIVIHGLLKAANLVKPLRRHLDEGVKPKPVFARGLFVRGHRLLKRGGLLPQVWVRTSSGAASLSDELLGPSLALVGLGADAGGELSDSLRQRFVRAGGAIVTLVSSPASVDTVNAHEVIEPGPLSNALSRRWCAVVRPDRTILHDGPAVDAERIVREALALVEARSTRRLAKPRSSEQPVVTSIP
jgi:3-(3-hydroxy-phenyl)propionate hydroxylase